MRGDSQNLQVNWTVSFFKSYIILEGNLKNKAIKGVAWNFIGTSANKIIQFAITLVLARLLTPTDYGLIGMLGFFIGIANTFIDSGFSSALIQQKDRRNEDYCTVFYINFGMSVLMYAILALTAPLIASFYNQPALTKIIRIYSLTLIIGALTAINNVRLTIDLNYKASTMVASVAALISGIIGIVFAYIGYGVWSLVIQQLIASLIRTILLFYYVKWFPALTFSFESFKRLFGYGSKLLGASLISTIYSQMYPLVIGKQFPAADLGYMTRAKNFNEVITENVTNIFGQVAFPVLTRVQDDDDVLLRMYNKYMHMSSFVIFPLVLFLCGIAKPLVLFLLTEKWAPCILLLQILSFGYLWKGIIKINLNLLYVKGRTDLVLKLEIIKKSIAFAILTISVFIGNLIVFCVGMTTYSFIALYLNTVYTKKLLNFGFIKQMKEILPYLIFSLIILGVALLFSNIISVHIISLIVSTAVCIPLYLFLCSISNVYALQQSVEIVAPKLGRLGKWLESKVGNYS